MRSGYGKNLGTHFRFMKHINFLLIFTVITIAACKMDSKKNNTPNERLQKVFQKDSNGRIIMTFDGFIYRVFDSLGRQVEWYGNYKNEESNSNIHNIVEYSGDSLITLKEYLLEDLNTDAKIQDPLDCYITKYYYENEILVRTEYFEPTKDETGKAKSHRLLETNHNPNFNPAIQQTLPSYLSNK